MKRRSKRIPRHETSSRRAMKRGMRLYLRRETSFSKRHYRVAYHPLARKGKNIWLLQAAWILLGVVAVVIVFIGFPGPLKGYIILGILGVAFLVEVFILGYSNRSNLRDYYSRHRR